MAFAARNGPPLLEEGVSRESVSSECRQAALDFMAGAASGWDKLDLVLWLTGPYAHATRHGGRGERITAMVSAAEIPAATIEELVGRVRSHLLAALERVVLSQGELEFADDMLDRGYVRRAIDRDGIFVWIPVDGARMRLRDRLRALFAADYLNDTSSYASLFVCHRCEAVVFDEDAKRLGFCAAHRRLSGIVPKKVESRERVDDEDASLAALAAVCRNR
jgi:hypothetical protein